MGAANRREPYEPYDDLRLYPGIHLGPLRRKALDEDDIEPDELSNEDIIYKLSRMVTGTMYSLLELVEERLGEEQTRDLMVEGGRRRARENLRKWMSRRGLERLTPELWARFQDYRHLISGPVHAPSFIRYAGDSDLVLDRTGCLFHDGRPEGMNSYCGPAADGMFAGYAEVCPELSSEHPICKARGTSDSDHCQVRFSIKSGE